MKRFAVLAAPAAVSFSALAALPVVLAENPQILLHSDDPKRAANKPLAYDVFRIAGHRDSARVAAPGR